MDRSGPLWIPTPWPKFPSPNLVHRSGPPYIDSIKYQETHLK